MKFKLFFFIIFLIPNVMWAGSFTASLSESQVAVGEEVVLSLAINGSEYSEPTVPNVDGLSVLGSSQSTNISIVNGNYTKEITFNYTIVPEKAGSFTIPSIELKVDGENLKSLPLTLKVTDSPQAPPSDGSDPANAGNNPNVFIERSFSKHNPYVGEPIVETINIYHKVSIDQASPSGKDSSEFRYFNFEEQVNSKKQIGNDIYNVITVRKVLVPNSAGKKILSPYKLDTVIVERGERNRRDPFSGFFDMGGKRVRKVFTSKEEEIDVQPLPQGAPAGFKGAVGKFQLSVDLSKRQLNVGETATLTVKLEGDGSLDSMSEVALQWPQIKTYPDKPVGNQRLSATVGLVSDRTFKIALVPTSGGTIALGQLNIPVFNPETKVYENLSSDLGNLEVSGSAASQAAPTVTTAENTTSLKQNVKTLNTDILDIHRNISFSESHVLTIEQMLMLSLIAIVPGALLLVVFGVTRTRSALVKKQSSKTHTYKDFNRDVAMVKKHLLQSEIQIATNLLYQSFKNYLAMKLKIAPTSATPKEIIQSLKLLKIEETLIFNVEKQLAYFERISYSGQALNSEIVNQLIDQTVLTVKKVDEQC